MRAWPAMVSCQRGPGTHTAGQEETVELTFQSRHSRNRLTRRAYGAAAEAPWWCGAARHGHPELGIPSETGKPPAYTTLSRAATVLTRMRLVLQICSSLTRRDRHRHCSAAHHMRPETAWRSLICIKVHRYRRSSVTKVWTFHRCDQV